MPGLIMPWAAGMLNGAGSVAGPTVEYQGSSNYSGASVSTITYTSVSFGDADASRVVVVVVHMQVDRPPSSMTIGGVSATEAVTQSLTSDSGCVSIWYASVPTGTSGTVVVNLSGGSSTSGKINVYSLYNATATPTNTGSNSVGTGTISVSATVSAGGVGIVGVTDEVNNALHTPTNYTEVYDEQVIGTGDGVTGGTFTASATLSCENTGTNTDGKAMAYASWAA